MISIIEIFLWLHTETIMALSILKFFVSQFLLCSVIFCGKHVRQAVAVENGRAINIGVILEKDWYGIVAKVAFELAAEDVNKENKLPNSSGLALHFRFSESDGQNAVMAASAAVDLLKKQVVAIIGPQTSQEAGFVIDLCTASKVPMISFSVTDPLLSAHRYPYFIRLPHSDAVQADAIAALVEYYGWRKIVAVYADNDYGTGMLPFLTDSLSNVGCEIAYRSAISANANRIATRTKLSELEDMQTRVFVVHMTSDMGALFFSEAKNMGMMSREYAWIITEGLSAVLDVMDESSIASMEGVLGTTSYIPNSTQLLDFDRRWKQRFIAENPPEGKPTKLNIYGYYAYDAVWMIAQALKRFGNADFIFSESPNESFNTQLSTLPVFKQGEQLLQLLGNTNFSGLSGQLEISEGEVTGAPYEILNVLGKGKGYRPIGRYWKSNGTFNSSRGMSELENVTWPGGSTNKPCGWATPTNSKPLRIAVPIKDGFQLFVATKKNASGVAVVPEDNPGFVIELFRAVLPHLSYDVPHEFIPYNHGTHLAGYYDDLIQQISLKRFDAAVGDFTILANRSMYVDFTQPYFESGLVMVVPIKAANPSNAWTFILPFTPGMWTTTGALFVFTGLVVWLVEHKVNETFRGKPKEQVTTILWFSFSTLFFSQREKVVNGLARGVIIIWLFVVLILQSSYTANLTAILTAKQMQPTIEDLESLKSSGLSVGYLDGSFVGEYLVEHLGIDRKKLNGYSSPQEYANALSKGSVAAVFDETPYICVVLSQQTGLTIVGETYRTGGLGFAFPKGSPLVSDISTAVLEVAEGPESQEIRKRYFKKYFNTTGCSNGGPQENSNRLSMESFWGLFLITGSASVMGLLIYLGRLVSTYVRHRLPQEQQHFPSTKHLVSSRFKNFLNYMDEKKESNNSKETSRENDENLPEAPNFGISISTPPAWESPVSVNSGGDIEEEGSGYEDTSVTTGGPTILEEETDSEDTISSALSSRSSSFFLLRGEAS